MTNENSHQLFSESQKVFYMENSWFSGYIIDIHHHNTKTFFSF